MVLNRVDESLLMLDTHTHSEALRLEAHAIVMQRVVNILCRVARSQHYGSTLDELVANPYAAYAAARAVNL
jgi:hypothetical protein